MNTCEGKDDISRMGENAVPLRQISVMKGRNERKTEDNDCGSEECLTDHRPLKHSCIKSHQGFCEVAKVRRPEYLDFVSTPWKRT